MPHSSECQAEVVELGLGPGYCIGGCTITRDDAPGLYDTLAKAGLKQRLRTNRRMPTFEVTEDHLKLVKRMYWDWDDSAYDGAPAVGIKRPYGNSDVWGDIVEILELPTITDRYGEESFTDETQQRAEKIHREMATVLQIATCTLSWEPGVYRKETSYDSLSWKKVEANATD